MMGRKCLNILKQQLKRCQKLCIHIFSAYYTGAIIKDILGKQDFGGCLASNPRLFCAILYQNCRAG